MGDNVDNQSLCSPMFQNRSCRVYLLVQIGQVFFNCLYFRF